MPVPSYEALLLPLLQSLADGDERAMGELRDVVAAALKLTPEARSELLPSGRQTVFANRLGWAKTYLEKAGLLETTRRGVYRVSAEGRALLASRPDSISNATLGRYPSFRSFVGRDGAPDEGASPTPATQSLTPREQLEAAYGRLRAETERELLALVRQRPWDFFERLVVELLVAMGYGGGVEDADKALVVGRSGDGGIDGVIKQDALGLDSVYVQAKRWEHNVGRPDVQAFVGSLEGVRARKGVFLTTSDFTREAREYVGHIDKRVVLVDGEKLAALMFEHGVGVTTVETYALKRIDSDFFDDA